MCILKKQKQKKNTHCLVPIRGGENNNVKCAESLLDLDLACSNADRGEYFKGGGISHMSDQIKFTHHCHEFF